MGFHQIDGQRWHQQGRNFTEAMKAMAAVAPLFGLVPLQKMTCLKATVALMPQMTVALSALSIACHIDISVSC